MLVCLLTLTLVLAACGNKGDLVLPDAPADAAVQSPPRTEAGDALPPR